MGPERSTVLLDPQSALQPSHFDRYHHAQRQRTFAYATLLYAD
jgi:hypothetical protein